MKKTLSALILGCTLLVPLHRISAQATKTVLTFTDTKYLEKTITNCSRCYCDNSLVVISNDAANPAIASSVCPKSPQGSRNQVYGSIRRQMVYDCRGVYDQFLQFNGKRSCILQFE